MQSLIACSTFAIAVTLAVKRPRIGANLEISPAAAAVAGMVCLLAFGTVQPSDIAFAFTTLWRPLVGIVSIMVTTAVAHRLGVMDALADVMLARQAGSPRQAFRRVFLLSLATASLLSNDAAVLLLTPLVLAFVRSRYPAHPNLLVPFAFAVFMAAGVAPLVISNPMNMVVASYAGLNFNAYAAAMLPVSLIGSIVTLWLLERVFGTALSAAVWTTEERRTVSAFTRGRIKMLALLFGVVGSYSLVAAFDGSAIWVVGATGAVLALLLSWSEDRASPYEVMRRGVAWDVLIFLPAVFVLTIGLRNVGLVDLLSGWYANAGLGVIGATSAIGSAVLNNHPMSLVNMLALETRPGTGPVEFLAALVGGDLGPRLLPTGSLAGLLWLESCRQLGVHVSPGTFVGVGLILTGPTLVVSLALLAWL